MTRTRFFQARSLQALVVFAVVAVGLVVWLREVGGPAGVYARYGLLAPAISVPAHALVKSTAFGELVPWAVANGMLYGFAPGALMTWLAWMAATLLQFGLARRTARDFDLEAHLGRLPRWLARFPVSHPVFLITVRWLPFGASLANAGAGALGVRLPRLLWCSAVGYVPQALFYAALGAELLRWL